MKKNYLNLYIILILSNILICQKLNETLYPLNSLEYKVLNIYNRENDNKIYTQGLFFSDDKNSIYESGGLYGESRIIQLKYPSLEIIKETRINNKYFGEGIAKCNNFIYQLTWRERKIIKYDYYTLEKINEINMDYQMKEGWGLSISNNENELFATDGSDKIFRLDCNQNLKVIDIIKVKFNGHSVNYLNDLIYNNGFIYLNIYLDNRIAKVNIQNGEIVKFYNMQNLIEFEFKKGILTTSNFHKGDVLNGIAYNDKNQSILITGKRWGYMYEIVFNE